MRLCVSIMRQRARYAFVDRSVVFLTSAGGCVRARQNNFI